MRLGASPVKNIISVIGGLSALLMHTDPAIAVLGLLLLVEGGLTSLAQVMHHGHIVDSLDPWLRRVVLYGAVIVIVGLTAQWVHWPYTMETAAAALITIQISALLKALSYFGALPLPLPPTQGQP